MARIIDIFDENIIVINKFIKIGFIPLSLMNDYEIYLFYKQIDSEIRQMKKYEIVSKKFKISVNTVRRSISKMEADI